MNTQKITVQDFILKAQNKVKNRKLFTDVEIPSMECKVTCTRPSEEEMLEYINGITGAIKIDKEGTATGTNIIAMYEVSKKLVYSSCEYLRNPELHEALKIVDPFDIFKNLFDPEEVIDMAEEIYKEFADKKVKDKIKN